VCGSCAKAPFKRTTQELTLFAGQRDTGSNSNTPYLAAPSPTRSWNHLLDALPETRRSVCRSDRLVN
jgi:hypothetical protein